MSQRIDNFIIREADGLRFANSLVLGRWARITDTAGGLPELESPHVGEEPLAPSGGDDTQAIRDALARSGRARLGPGTFRVSATIALGSGQSLAGCGPARTRVNAIFSSGFLQAVIRVTGTGAAVEHLHLSGYGMGSCIVAESATDVELRDLRFDSSEYGIRLTNVIRGEVSRVFAEVTNTGVYVTGGAQAAISDVEVLGANGGIVLSQVDRAHCMGLTLRDCLTPIVGKGRALAFSSVLLDACPGSMNITDAQGVAVSGLEARDCPGSAVRISGSNAVAVSGYSALRTGTALNVSGSTAVTVDGLVSDNTGSGSTAPHVVVGSGSTLVTVTSVHVVSPATPPQFEVDVSGAGSRVVFIQHDFDPARINSGGNFVAL